MYKHILKGDLLMKKLFFALVIFILFASMHSVYAEEVLKPSCSIDDHKWEYRVGDSPMDEAGIPIFIKDKNSSSSWQPCSAPRKGKSNIDSNYLWIKTTLNDYHIEEPALLLYTYDKTFELYLDDKLMSKFGDFNSINDKYSPGSAWHIITLPKDYAGKTVYIRMYSLNKYSTGILGKFDIGPKSSFPEKLFKQDIDTIVLVGLFVFVGICSFLISFIDKLRNNKKPLLYLGLFSIFTGIWLLSNTSIKQYFLNAPVLWLYLNLTAIYLMPVWLCLFLKSILNSKFAALLNLLALITSIFTVLSIAGSLLHLFSIYNSMKYFHILLICIILAITFMTVKSLFKGTKIERVFGMNFILLYVFAIIDLIRWYTVIDTVKLKFFTQWAMLFFIVSMFFSIIVHLAESQAKLEVYSEEIKLKEEILEEKKKLLLEMSKYDKMKNEFFVNMSHELRTPINIILSTIQLIKLYIDNGKISADQIELQRHLKIMKQNCYRLFRLVNNIIDISKIESGYIEPDFHYSDIVAAVEDTTMSAANYIKSNGIELCFDTDVEEKFMCFDEDKIERVILNLLSNAVKFSNSGAIITVELTDNDDSVTIRVKDTGIGMHKDDLNSIFDRFVQVDKSLTRSQEGSGIGLSLVKSLVELHKGTITVESEYGKGTTFIITLPATLPETNKPNSEKLNLKTAPVEKVSIEFSDI